MDVLTHVFLPLTAVYVLKDFKAKYFPLALFAVAPDFDVFTGIHRGLFHSLLFLLPLACVLLAFEYLLRHRLELSALAVGFLFSHIALDLLVGGVPLLYPLVNQGVGLEFPFVVRFGESFSIVDTLPKIVHNCPQPVYGEMNAFSGVGVAMAAVFTIIYWRTYKERDERGVESRYSGAADI